MDFCKALKKALEKAPDEETRAALEALFAAHCGEVTAFGGGNGNGPPGVGGGG